LEFFVKLEFPNREGRRYSRFALLPVVERDSTPTGRYSTFDDFRDGTFTIVS